jgi:hypothetical protein
MIFDVSIKRISKKDDGPDKGATHSSPHLSTGVIFFSRRGDNSPLFFSTTIFEEVIFGQG